jgi:hypothetical protein
VPGVDSSSRASPALAGKEETAMATPQDILDALRKLEDSLYERLSADISAFRLEFNARFDAIEARLEKLETEYQMIVAGLDEES